jgi:hypothetical protein
MLQEAGGTELTQDHRPTRGGGRAPELLFTAKERHALPIEQQAVAIVGGSRMAISNGLCALILA